MKTEYQGQMIRQTQRHEKCFHMVLQTDAQLIEQAIPGQFVHLRVTGEGTPFLRRPFSIHRVNPEEQTLELLYAVVGQGTRRMAESLEGQRFNLLGPLGTGFPDPPAGSRRVVLVGGGMGIAPLLFAADVLKKRSFQLVIIMGFPSEDHIVCRNAFDELEAEVMIATEDGSAGFKGLPTDLLRMKLGENGTDTVFACGPSAMMESVKMTCEKTRTPAWISMEERMACGVGACLGCVVTVKDNGVTVYRKACVDGPVFAAAEVIFP